MQNTGWQRYLCHCTHTWQECNDMHSAVHWLECSYVAQQATTSVCPPSPEVAFESFAKRGSAFCCQSLEKLKHKLQFLCASCAALLHTSQSNPLCSHSHVNCCLAATTYLPVRFQCETFPSVRPQKRLITTIRTCQLQVRGLLLCPCHLSLHCSLVTVGWSLPSHALHTLIHKKVGFRV